MMTFPHLARRLASHRLPHKGAEFNAKSSLSTTRRTRKYEAADGLEFRLCRVRASGRPSGNRSRPFTGGNLGGLIRTVMRHTVMNQRNRGSSRPMSL